VKILAVFLGLVFLSPAAVIRAQNDKDCGFPPALKRFTVERRVRVESGPPLEIVSPQIVEDLEDGQNCLNENLMGLKTSIKGLDSLLVSNNHLETDILDLQDKLKQTELALHTAETKIETLEDRLKSDERWIAEIPFLVAAVRKPNALASKPQAPASKPTAPLNKPKPTVDSPKDQ
jgi:hypothetical protein